MRWFRWPCACLAVLLPGCAWHFLKTQAASAIDCPRDALTIRDRKDGYVVDGCGRTAYCYRAWWNGPDEWICETGGDIPSVSGQGQVVDRGKAAPEPRPPAPAPEVPRTTVIEPKTLAECLDGCRSAYRACMNALVGSERDAAGPQGCRYETDLCRETCRARFPESAPTSTPTL